MLVTGGTGFLGRPLIDRLAKLNCEIRTIARNEGKIVALRESFPQVECVLGDISDPHYAKKATEDVDIVFHLAAMKSVGLAEDQPYQCIMSNIMGTSNILKYADVAELVLGISTDKAAQIRGVYGASKYIMEKLFQEFAEINPQTQYRTVRYGNVLYSTGSVLTKWREKIEAGQELIITEPKATRFFWTVDQAIDLIFECIQNANSPTPYVPNMKGMEIWKLLEAMIAKYCPRNQKPPQVTTIGLQPGENMHETIDGTIFSNQVDQYTINEIKELI